MKIDVYENMYIFWSLIYTVCEVLNSLIFSIIASVLGMLHNWTEFFMEVVCCKFKLGKYETKDIITNNSGGSAPASLTENTSSNLPNVNLYSSPNSWPQLVETRKGRSCRHIAGIKPSVLFQKYSQSASESVNFIYWYVSHLSSNQLHLFFFKSLDS